MSPDTARAIKLLKLMTAMPAPKDPAKLAELTRSPPSMEGMYGAGKYCTGEGDSKTPAASSANSATCCASQPRLRRAAGRLAGLAHHRQPMRKDYIASPNWSTKAPRKWASPTPARCGAAATT
jgi:peptidyl-dipeptidase A